MGYFGIPIKPSTILVFGIALGISVDGTIHFLTKYRQEMLANDMNISYSVQRALRETGPSLMYTGVILFFGFMIFTFSGFGGTVALGFLISMTLLVAMIGNLLLLPTLLISLEKYIKKKELLNPMFEISDDTDDCDSEMETDDDENENEKL
jgi:hypothetical protein